ncbi:MAG: Ohr family peroxiredoxin [Pseudomonadota bacterium]
MDLTPRSENHITRAFCTAVVTAHGGRDPHVVSADQRLRIDLAPSSSGRRGRGGRSTTPEELFAAGYAACFEAALRVIARAQNSPLGDIRVTAEVSFGPTQAGAYALSVALRAHIEGLSSDETIALMTIAHDVCPQSRATRGNIEVHLAAE